MYDGSSLQIFRPNYVYISPLPNTPAIPIQQILLKLPTLIIFRKGNGKLVRLIKMCLTETYSRVRVGKKLSDIFPIRNGLKQVDALSPLLFNFDLEYASRRVQVN